MYTGTAVRGAVITAGGGAALARTGVPVVGFTLLAIALVVVGFGMVRLAMMRRGRS